MARSRKDPYGQPLIARAGVSPLKVTREQPPLTASLASQKVITQVSTQILISEAAIQTSNDELRQNYFVGFSDFAYLADSLDKSLAKIQVDAIAASESLHTVVNKTLLEGCPAVEKFRIASAKAFPELVSTLETFSVTATFFRSLQDDAFSSDTVVKVLSRRLEEYVSLATDVFNLACGVGKTDSASVVDLCTVSLNLCLADAVFCLESFELFGGNPSQQAVDSCPLLEVFSLTTSSSRQDSVATADLLSLSTAVNASDVASSLESFAQEFSKPAIESVTSSEHLSLTSVKAVNEPATVSETLTLFQQDYFLEDFVEPGYNGSILTY